MPSSSHASAEDGLSGLDSSRDGEEGTPLEKLLTLAAEEGGEALEAATELAGASVDESLQEKGNPVPFAAPAVGLQDIGGHRNHRMFRGGTRDPKWEDQAVLHLIRSTRTCTAAGTLRRPGTPSASDGNAQFRAPARRFLHVIHKVISDRRWQFLHFRLQCLMFERRHLEATQFEQQEAVESPRAMQEVEMRRAWWWHVRGHGEVQRKADIIIEKPPAEDDDDDDAPSPSPASAGSAMGRLKYRHAMVPVKQDKRKAQGLDKSSYAMRHEAVARARAKLKLEPDAVVVTQVSKRSTIQDRRRSAIGTAIGSASTRETKGKPKTTTVFQRADDLAKVAQLHTKHVIHTDDVVGNVDDRMPEEDDDPLFHEEPSSPVTPQSPLSWRTMSTEDRLNRSVKAGTSGASSPKKIQPTTDLLTVIMDATGGPLPERGSMSEKVRRRSLSHLSESLFEQGAPGSTRSGSKPKPLQQRARASRMDADPFRPTVAAAASSHGRKRGHTLSNYSAHEPDDASPVWGSMAASLSFPLLEEDPPKSRPSSASSKRSTNQSQAPTPIVSSRASNEVSTDWGDYLDRESIPVPKCHQAKRISEKTQDQLTKKMVDGLDVQTRLARNVVRREMVALEIAKGGSANASRTRSAVGTAASAASAGRGDSSQVQKSASAGNLAKSGTASLSRPRSSPQIECGACALVRSRARAPELVQQPAHNTHRRPTSRGNDSRGPGFQAASNKGFVANRRSTSGNLMERAKAASAEAESYVVVPEARAAAVLPPAGRPPCPGSVQAYLEEASVKGQMPMVPKVLLQSVPSDGVITKQTPQTIKVDLRRLNLSDSEASALFQGLRAHSASITELLLGGNPRLSEQTYLSILSLVHVRSLLSCVRLHHLDLSGAKGMGEKALSSLAQELKTELRELHSLRLDGVFIPEPVWPQLEESLHGLLALTELRLGDTRCGFHSQRSAVCAAEMLLGLPALTSLDISHNNFAMDGCKALADNLQLHTTLSRLDLSYNKAHFVFYTHGMMNPAGAANSRMQYNPLSWVCEGLAKSSSLKALALASCQLTYDEGFILEDAVLSKIGAPIEELDLVGNPCLGIMGTRSIARMLVRVPSLKRVHLREIREALPADASIPFERTSPSCRYELNLEHPQHRALLRMLVKQCVEDGEAPGAYFNFDDPAQGNAVIKLWTEGRGVPLSGTLNFIYQLPPVENCHQRDIVELLDSLTRARKLSVSLMAFVRVSDFFRHLIDETSRLILVGALAADLLFKLVHVRYLAELDSKLRGSVVDNLIPTVLRLRRVGGFDFMFNEQAACPSNPFHIRRFQVARLLFFNPRVPTGHYQFDMLVPASRRIMQQLVIINEWEAKRSEKHHEPDLSQQGGRENMRNMFLNNVAMVWHMNESSIPPRGDLIFDYCSPGHPPHTAEPTPDEVILQVRHLLIEADCEAEPKVAALRMILHRLTLRAYHLHWLISVMPGGAEEPPENNEDTAWPRYEDPLVPMTGLDETNSSEYCMPRADAFMMMYTRCTEIGELLSSKPYGMYGLQMLTRAEALLIRHRLGRLRTWDFTRIDSEIVVPKTPEEEKMNKLQLMEHAEVDAAQWKHLTASYKLRDDPTSRGNANRLVLNLALHEDRRCAIIMFALSQKEPGAHYDSPSWSEVAHLEARGARWLVPPEWHAECPDVGTFIVRYFCERDAYKDPQSRLEIARALLGW